MLLLDFINEFEKPGKVLLSHLLNQKSGIVKFLLLHEAKDLNEWFCRINLE